MKHIFKNWKTTVLGLVTIFISILSSRGKIDAGTAAGITSGAGLILASDSSNTGGAVTA
jgi:hypothetical protein